MTRLSRYRPDRQKHKKRALILAIMMIVLSVFDLFTGTVSAASSHSTRISLSAEQIKQNGNVTLTAEAVENGSTVTSGYTYRFLYNTDGGTSAYPLGDYSSQNWYTLKPSEVSRLKNYTGSVFVYADTKKNGVSVWSKYKILNIIPNDGESLKATGTVTSAGNYTVGDKLIVTMTASGGKAPYKYKYEYSKAGGSYSTYKDNTTTSSVTIPTDSWAANTDYYIKVTVTDSDSKTFSYVSAVSLSPKPVPVPTVTSVSVASSGKVGDKLKINCNATGGTSPLQYKFTYINSSNTEKVIRDYGTSDNVTWDTSNLAAGNYTVKAIVKDSNGKTANQKATVSLTVSTPSITSFSVQNSAKAGEKINLSCDAKDGTGTLQYKFTYINSSNNETIIKDYSTSDNTTWDTAGLVEGSYTVKAIVKDSNDKKAERKVTVKISKAPTLSPTVSTDPNNATVVKGKDITFTVDTHSDGSENYPPQPYQYKFEYKSGNGNYQTIKAYSSSEKYKYNTKNLAAGNYTLKATVKDKNGKEYSKTVNFTVEVPKITFSVSPGSKDFFTGGGSDKAVIEVKNVKGGTSDEYEYKFEYVKYGELTDNTLTPPTNSSSWEQIKDFSGESSADFTVSKDDQAGIYAVRVSVQNKDNTNNNLIYRKIIQNYTVKVKVQHTLADINNLIDKIDTWTSNSIQGDMQGKIEEWSSDSEHYDEYPFSYTDYKAAYDAAKASNTNGNKDYDTLYSNLETQFSKLQKLVNSGYVSPNLETGDSPIGIANAVFLLYKGLLNVVTDTFKSLSDSSVTSTVMYGFDYNVIADKIFPLFKTFAYALIIIFAGVNALETALQYEMFTMRGGVKILARLTLAKVWVDVSLIVCRGIVSIATDWLGQIINLTSDIANSINVGVSLQHSDAWIIGWLIDFFNGLLLAAGILLVLIPLLVLILIMFIKLFIRSFELAMLQCVSPVFFACLTGEATKQYFRKFILTYISVVVEVVFMAVIWYVYIEYLNQAFSVTTEANSVLELFSLEGGIINFFMVSVGAFILMIKPPQVLKNLVTA